MSSIFTPQDDHILSPTVIRKNAIPCNMIVQEAGEFMVSFPFGYHAGFNHGFNAAASTNFASPRWVEYGKWASRCLCRPDAVVIDMTNFVKQFQPERYELWLAGKESEVIPKSQRRKSHTRLEVNQKPKIQQHKLTGYCLIIQLCNNDF